MKYVAILDTDNWEDFKFFEGRGGKFLRAIDANTEKMANGLIYLPFKPLDQYENRLKVAMLAELQKKVSAQCINYPLSDYDASINVGIDIAADIIQQEIDKLNAKSEE